MYQPAILNTARVNNFRLGYRPAGLVAARATTARILLGGVPVSTRLDATRVRLLGLSIHDVLNDSPNTASLTVQGTAPVVSEPLRVTINTDDPRLLFNGTLQRVDLSWQGNRSPNLLIFPAVMNLTKIYPCQATDDLASLNRRRPFGSYVAVSASTVVLNLMGAYGIGFTATHVQAGLPAITIAFDGSEPFSACLAQCAKSVGAYFYFEDHDLHFFTTEATDLPDAIDNTPGRFLADPPIRISRDVSQVRTRVYGKGSGTTSAEAVSAGATILPVADSTMFSAVGGLVIIGTEPEGNPYLTRGYTGKHVGGAGAIVGTGISLNTTTVTLANPTAGPSVGTPTAGGNVDVGSHSYAVSFANADGETLSVAGGSSSTANTAAVSAPASNPTPTGTTGGALTPSSNYLYLTTFLTATGETAGVMGGTYVALTAGQNAITLTNILTSADSRVIGRRVYRNRYLLDANDLPHYFLVVQINNNAATTYTDTQPDSEILIRPSAPSVDTTPEPGPKTIPLTSIQTGPTGTTSRHLYRTMLAGAWRRCATINNNTATTYSDTASDASIAGNADLPSSNTAVTTTVSVSGGGQIAIGATSLLLADASLFSSGGGWLRADAQLIRYGGKSGTTLTGIPSSGAGSITAPINYGSTVTVQAALIGVTPTLPAMTMGSRVHIWIQRDDLAAQTAMAALDYSDGVYEYTIIDEQSTEAALVTLCDAHLTLYSRPLDTVVYATRDVKSKSGKPVVLDLTDPPIHATLTIQDVTISEIGTARGVAPRFTVTASTVRQSLEAVLRGIIRKGRVF
jgi:hypothetical protein